jgi:hypothetical protein
MLVSSDFPTKFYIQKKRKEIVKDISNEENVMTCLNVLISLEKIKKSPFASFFCIFIIMHSMCRD